MTGRTKNTVRNMVVMFAMQVITVIFTFVCRTFFVKLLAVEYYGLSGLFSNIIAVLALSELGIGNVIIVHLYKPLAENDQEQICQLMNFYRKAYNVVGIFVFVCGLLLVPFLDKLVKSDSNIPYLEFYFILFIIQSASSYFFAYKRSLLTASQQEYICTAIRQFFIIILNLLQILFLWLTRSYTIYLVLSIISSLATNITLSFIADRKFPYLKEGRKYNLAQNQTKEMFKNVSAMMLHRIGNTVINSTDNILISSMVGIIYTGLYSNYLLIMNTITQFINISLSAVSASIGDYNAQKTPKERKELFDAMSMISIWGFGMSSICFCCLFQPTITLWLGEAYLLDFSVVVLISANYFINGLLRVPGTFSDLNGVYVKTKFKPILMATINLLSSVIFIKLWGFIGVFAGTLVSYLLVGIWVDPILLCRDVFKIKSLTYFFDIFKQTLIVICVGFITFAIVQMIPFYVIKLLASVVISNGLLLLFYRNTKAFSFVFSRIKRMLHR